MHSAGENILKEVAGHFNLSRQYTSIRPMGDGHIHDTFRVETSPGSHPGFVLQRINNRVFRNVPSLMDNIRRVTSHLQQKNQTAQQLTGVLELVAAADGKYFYKDSQDAYWRCFVYCCHRHIPVQNATAVHAREAGKMLGTFQALLADLPGPPLHETIMGFHDLQKRLSAFHEAVKSDPARRVDGVRAEIRSIDARKAEMLHVHRLVQSAKIPVRVTHNDTKFNNFLFDDAGRALCLIDLDTVMNGTVLHDFGDAIRTLANTSDEDHPESSTVAFDFERFQHFAGGYLGEASAFITPIETENLAFSARLMTYTMAVRFLTDYLLGDPYYKTTHEKHNLHRAANQLQLLARMEEQREDMENCIRNICAGRAAVQD